MTAREGPETRWSGPCRSQGLPLTSYKRLSAVIDAALDLPLCATWLRGLQLSSLRLETYPPGLIAGDWDADVP